MIRPLGIVLLILLVACVDRPEYYQIPKSQIRTCDCAPAFWGRERVASICQSGPKEGPPPTRGCLYKRGNMTVFDQPLEPQI
jgi:hypothetical protein